MNTYSGDSAVGPAPIPPSPVVRAVMRPLTRVLNPMIGKLAGRRHFSMAAQLRHRGRRSGRGYVTPVGARLAGDSLLIALTFGNQSDWVRNVLAAGGCEARLRGGDYAAAAPELLSWDEAGPFLRTAFKTREQAMLRLLGIRQFMRLRIGADPARLEEHPAATVATGETELP
jgi:deazaflavin-dependent oxidoreductase (nitroreductase family)